MKPPLVIVLLVVVVLAAVPPSSSAELSSSAEPAASSPKAPAPPPLSPRFKQVRDRIDALFQHRNDTPPPPNARLNPFRAPGVVLEAPTPSGGPAPVQVAAPKPAIDDVTLLQQSLGTLKVSGTFEKNGNSYLVINAKPYKEKDVIQTQVQGETVYLRIRQITRDSVTLLLNEAETTLKF